MTQSNMLFHKKYQTLLHQLLEIDTVTPMEGGVLSNLEQAHELFARSAAELGFQQVARVIGEDNDSLPLSVKSKYGTCPEDFFRNQPSIVLGFGEWCNREQTIMFNFHMDTVGPVLPVSEQDGKLKGRGVIDNKGPGVAVLAAVAQWLKNRPDSDNTGVLIQVVGGEEGGAMGTYGTKLLFEQGFYGALNLFVIPSEGRYFDCSTTSMTVEVSVDGQGSTDDSPASAHNATAILSSMVVSLSKTLAPRMDAIDVKMTISGLHTGEMHNRVYGTGRLLINFAYHSQVAGRKVEQLFSEAFEQARLDFKDEFKSLNLFKLSAEELDEVLSFRWLKKGLPVLSNRSETYERMLSHAGVERHLNSERTFTCDAMWGQRHDCYSIMYGPGSLELNGAHTDQEEIFIQDLETYSQSIFNLLNQFSEQSAQNHSKEIFQPMKAKA
ncbi:M20/M25/M40 family metallo-hydrolase [Algicola sagamiensis]|uniref:M20/M25/M40 family metallo-hydrolase n=1 Tax=Algicola sagamiensis TaxID=163869 RepID=UPI000373C3E0|nr:M20/M25/M40 family metallo-hydrolase [Algicola sagamiensis]